MSSCFFPWPNFACTAANRVDCKRRRNLYPSFVFGSVLYRQIQTGCQILVDIKQNNLYAKVHRSNSQNILYEASHSLGRFHHIF